MKYEFILDENIIVFATKMCNAEGEEDYTSTYLILNIAENCHRIIYNNELYMRYTNKVDEIPQGSMSFKAIRVISHMLKDQRKSRDVKYVPELDLKELSIDDRSLVKMAVHTNAILISSDRKLRDKIVNLGLNRLYNLRVVDPREALQYARHSNP
ncbi:MAG: hypothetical protein QXH67_00790 [Candidatus Bathyarchaeia archaeon]